jgi:hypothetical protein
LPLLSVTLTGGLDFFGVLVVMFSSAFSFKDYRAPAYALNLLKANASAALSTGVAFIAIRW